MMLKINRPPIGDSNEAGAGWVRVDGKVFLSRGESEKLYFGFLLRFPPNSPVFILLGSE